MFSLTPLGDLTRFRPNNVKNEAYLITQDVSIKVHGIILAARSAKIEVMLEKNEKIKAVEFSDDLSGLEDCHQTWILSTGGMLRLGRITLKRSTSLESCSKYAKWWRAYCHG